MFREPPTAEQTPGGRATALPSLQMRRLAAPPRPQFLLVGRERHQTRRSPSAGKPSPGREAHFLVQGEETGTTGSPQDPQQAPSTAPESPRPAPAK
ncbi:hypothetical protein NDU88_003090 [Pleurodeles waltl]|uniref:Uncharacterized protein n=1 Tax=Pleurodeles waltl TaxID=8319 RepID=A0AAV7RFL0_PLEWA|nr:hypothetical protein NDU88_003090 [Pleurodeles waltl]